MWGHLYDDGSEGVLAAKVADQGQGESDCSHPDRKSKRSTPRGGGVEEKGAISQAKLLLGWRREKYHSNNSTREERREGERGGGGAEGSRKEEGGPKQKLNYQCHQTCTLT